MQVTAKSLRERYSSMNTEALADLYHAGGMTDLAVSVLKDEITSRGLDWAQFTKPSTTEPESEPASESLSDWSLWWPASGRLFMKLWKSESDSLSDWELWKSETKKAADKIRAEPIHDGNRKLTLGEALFLFLILLAFVWAIIEEPARLWGLFIVCSLAVLGVAVKEVGSAICPSCRRWFAFKKKVGTRLISREKSKTKEEKWVCTHCGHRKWVEVTEPSSGVYVGSGSGSGDDDGGGEGTCGGGE